MAVKCVLSLIDSMGRVVTKRIETNQTTLVDAAGAITDYLVDLEAVTDLGSIGSSYSEIGAGDTFSVTSGSNVDTGATFKVLTGTGKKAAHHVPGFKQSLAGGNGEIDVTGNEVVAYFANFLTGGELRLSDGEYVVSVISGKMDK